MFYLIRNLEPTYQISSLQDLTERKTVMTDGLKIASELGSQWVNT